MANTTYSLPLNTVAQRDKAAEVMVYAFFHMIAWKRNFNIDFVSCVRNGAALDVTFSDPIPAAERQAIQLSVN